MRATAYGAGPGVVTQRRYSMLIWPNFEACTPPIGQSRWSLASYMLRSLCQREVHWSLTKPTVAPRLKHLGVTTIALTTKVLQCRAAAGWDARVQFVLPRQGGVTKVHPCWQRCTQASHAEQTPENPM